MSQAQQQKLKGSWNVIKGKAKQQWGKLSDDDLTQIDGRRDELVGRIQKAYGRSLEEAQKEVDRFEREATAAAPGERHGRP